jgi:hypothetical protein
MISFLVNHPMITASLWAVLYFFDYSATLWFARLYRQSLFRHFTYEGGVEMNPVFEKDVAGLRLASLRFWVLLILMVTVLLLFGWFDYIFGNYEFMVGAFLLLWIFIDLRHIRNLYFHLHLKNRPSSVEGHIKQSYWLNQRLVAFDAFTFSAIYGLAWLASGRQFFLGGMFVCFALALRHFFLANRKPKVDISPASFATKNEQQV